MRGHLEQRPSEYSFSEYRAADGRIIELICPWPLASGMIPPPTITFNGAIVFTYLGSDEA